MEALLGVPPENRPAVLDRVCGSDLELRDELESLLIAHDESEGFLATSAESFAAPYLERAAASISDKPGAVVGRYRLVEEIGRGGMGTVWVATRADGQFEHRVALKLVKRGMDTEEIIARFRRERQILATLAHPNIARLLDGGVGEDGRPYFVMEYIVGRPVTEYCDKRSLPIDERLRLFATACRVVGFAHRNLVVHRDIKPSNVLVSDTGELKLLDFGIARLTAPDGDGANLPTHTATRVMTPEYASPEQLAGGQVTTASDVYQLGLLLYELLTGQRPSKDARRPSTAVRRAVTRTDRMGSRHVVEPEVVSERRATTPARLHRRLRGDLDTIALRAIREEPERRYPSAEALAEDVERHLENLPIRFGGDRVSYRAAKFFRRHRLSVIAGAVVIAMGVGLLAFDLVRVRRQRDLARHEAEKATEIAQVLGLFLQGWSPDASDRGEVSAQKVLGDAATRAQRELGNRPEMLAAVLSLIGDFHTSLGEWRAADSLLTQALKIQEQLYKRPSSDLAATLARRGRFFRYRGQPREAATALQRSVAMNRAVFGPRHMETLRVQRELAAMYRASKRYRDSELVLREILSSFEAVTRVKSPFALEVASELGYVLFNQGVFDQSVEILRPTLERQRAIFGVNHTSTFMTTRSLGSVLRDRGELEAAEALHREAYRIARVLYGDVHTETEVAMYVLALGLHRRGKVGEAENLARQSLILAERLYGRSHLAISDRVGYLGLLRLLQGDTADAEQMLRRALAGLRRAPVAADPDLGDVLNPLAYILVRRGAPDANEIYRQAVEFDNVRPADLPDFVSDAVHFLAIAEHLKGDLRAAAEDYRRALRLYDRQLPSGHPYRVAAGAGLAALQEGRPPPF